MVGLPGAGKTTVRRRWQGHGALTMRALIRRERVREGERHRRGLVRALPEAVTSRVLQGALPTAGDAARFALAHPALQELVWDRLGAVPDETVRVVAGGLLWDAFAERAFADRVGGPEEILLSDEGIWQRLSYLFALTGDGATGDGTAGGVPQLSHPRPALDGLVVVAAPLDVATQRALARDRGFKEVGLLPAMHAVLDALVGQVRDAGIPCLELDATRPVPDSLAALEAFLTDLG
jgi:hypothetical protein